ncbi:MAG: hypothetical protein II992_02100 [Lachnospiraceae bacterium]|nr:hypothetical protein [Lachnospiraceae bacterium]
MANFFAWTGWYFIKYIAYIAIVVLGVVLGKAWGERSRSKKETDEESNK